MSYVFTPGKYRAHIRTDFTDADSGLTTNYINSGYYEFNKKEILVPFGSSSIEKITNMINAYYTGVITLEQVKSVWSIGDSRVIHLNSMSDIGVSEMHHPQDVEIVILDFNHDELTTPINNHSRALVSLGQKNCLRDAAVGDYDGQNNTENGYINPTDTNHGGWRECARRQWCNDVYYSAVESGIKALIKQVKKEATVGDESSTIEIVNDYVWLLSEYELWGNTVRGITREGDVYPYYQSYSRSKLPIWNTSRSTSAYWLRSPAIANLFCIMNGTLTAGRYYPSNVNGIACNFCW